MTRTRNSQRPQTNLRVETLEDRRTPAALLFADFSDPTNDAYWTSDGTWAIGPTAVQVGTPKGYYSDPSNDHTATTDNRLAGVVLGGSMPTTTGATGYLRSPYMDLSAEPSVTLSFWHWLNAPGTPYMKHTVEVFDGDKWNIVDQTGSASTKEGAWARESYDLTAYKSNAFAVRFGYQVLQAGSPAVGGWNVDDITIGRLPVAGTDNLQAAPGHPVGFTLNTLLANDSDADGDILAAGNVDAMTAQGGSVTSTSGGFVYTPPAGFQGVDTFHYTLTEDSGLSVQGTVRVVVGRPPVVGDDVIQVDPGQGRVFQSGDILANDSDPDGNTFTVTGIDRTTAMGGQNFSAVVPGSGIVSVGYTPPPGFHGIDSAEYTVTDSTGLSTTGTVRFFVDRAPVATDDAPFFANQDEPLSILPGQFLFNDTDPDGDLRSISAIDSRTRAGGSVTFDGSQYTYTPAAGFYGTDTFQYTVADPIGLTDTATATVTVNGRPVAGPDVYATAQGQRLQVSSGAGVLVNDSDPEGASLLLSLPSDGGPAHGTLDLQPNGAFTYTPDPGFHGTDTFHYLISDNQTTATGTVSLFVAGLVSTPPAPDLNPRDDTGARDDDNFTSARTLLFNGPIDFGTTATLFMDGAPVDSATFDMTTYFLVAHGVPVGPHAFTVQFADAAGNVGPISPPLTIVVAGNPVVRLAMAGGAKGSDPMVVRVADAAGAPLFDVKPGWKAADGVRIATGDLTGDGTADIVVTPTRGPGLGTVVAYDGVTGAELFRYAVLGPKVRLSIAVGDVNADGYADLLAAGLNGQSAGRVVGLSGRTLGPLFDWPRAAGTTVHGVLAADADGDLIADVLLFQTQKPFGTDVVAYRAADRSEVLRYDGAVARLTPTSRVAAGLIDADGLADLVVSNGGPKPQVTVISGMNGQTQIASFAVPTGGNGARAIALADVTGDSRAEIILGASAGPRSQGDVAVTDLNGTPVPGLSLDPFGPSFHGTIEV